MNTGTLFEPDYEALSQAKPDLIIAGGRAQDAYNKLSAIAPTIALDVDTQHFTQSLTQRTEQLASIFGKEEEAKTLLGNFSSQVNAIKQKSANAGSAMVLMISGGKMSAYTPVPVLVLFLTNWDSHLRPPLLNQAATEMW